MVISLDGFVCGEGNQLDWEIQDDSVSRYLIAPLLERTDMLLLGRNIYQGFEQVWTPMAEDASLPQDLRDFAYWIGDTPKVVFSSTLSGVTWDNSNLVSIRDEQDIAAEVNRLKTQDGMDMLAFGGAQFAQTLVKLRLVDEYQFKIQPIALGRGKALFSDNDGRLKLRLIESKAFDCGVITASYLPATAL